MAFIAWITSITLEHASQVFKMSGQALTATQPPIQWVPGLFPWSKAAGGVTFNYPPPSCVEVNNRRRCTLPTCLQGVDKENFTFTCPTRKKSVERVKIWRPRSKGWRSGDRVHNPLLTTQKHDKQRTSYTLVQPNHLWAFPMSWKMVLFVLCIAASSYALQFIYITTGVYIRLF
jgi:hypothetical protein